MQLVVFGSLGSDIAKYSDACIVLLEIRKVFKQGLNTLGAKEDQHVIKDVPEVGQVTGYGLVHHSRFEIDFFLLEVIDHIFLSPVRAWYEESCGRLMFLQGAGEVLYRPLTHKYLALAVLDKLLEVMGHSLGGAEILHVLGDLDAHLFTEAEKVVNAVLAGHHDCLEFIRADTKLTEFLFRDRLHMIKGPPVYLDSILLLNVIVG